ncbi:DUF4384 domain-containing protein [bacterium]|nr:DUF4384 domain-containing protein [bacterium]
MFNRKNIAIISVALLASIIFVNRIPAQESMSSEGKNDEKRSTIVEVDGYAFLSEDKTMGQLREEALANAKREALERAQTYIKSFTKVENYQLSYDLIQSQAEGFISILESQDYGVTQDNRYRYWIKAEVQYNLVLPKEITSEALVKEVNGPLTVYVWTARKTYQAGEKMLVYIQGNKDFYARVVYRDVQGNLLQLLPNPHRTANFIEGGKVVQIPGSDDQFDLEVGSPFGIEQIIVYASSAEMGDVSVENIDNVLYSVKDNEKDLGIKTRGVKIVKKSKSETSGAEFYEARCEVLTRM